MQSNQTHADLIRSAFTAQAGYISTSPAFVSEERLKWLLDLVRLSGSAEELQELGNAGRGLRRRGGCGAYG